MLRPPVSDMRRPTPPQTIGPFFGVLAPEVGTVSIVPTVSIGTRVMLAGSVVDGAGAAVTDALVEIWQADGDGLWPAQTEASGVPAPEDFTGFGRVATDRKGRFAIETIKPASVPGPDDRLQAPHLVVGVFARGLLTRLVTRVYFDDELANENDPVLMCVPLHRRGTLIAVSTGAAHYQFDIALQGVRETVFFDV